MKKRDIFDVIIDMLDRYFNRWNDEMIEKATKINKIGIKKKVKKIEKPNKNELFM
ncbi:MULTISPECIES: hypothetical protein [Ureibacillus]|uniref:Uncharacterized protein n=1 Tax=Ureibacillus thermosphaericus TaxID=51173 RepID=A0A840Q0S9_URETH|nr:hypothetical protein [Ureibacillus thermosphaericus]MBB5148676.1 hypothetical protein [Ureibacillus thermosphaericus]NKZ31392.1 hypothetical protein [Ureibacillus thermosphaericus]